MRRFFAGLLTAALFSGAARVMAADDLFTKLDANQDGQLTLDEIPEDKREFFERLLRTHDANGDKKLSQEEFAAAMKKGDEPKPPLAGGFGGPGGGGGNPAEMFKRLDKNSDGKLQADEVPPRIKEHFAALDTDGDGALSPQELVKGFALIAKGKPDSKAGEDRPQKESGAERGSLLALLDTNGDGELSAEEIQKAPQTLAKLDKNGDGKLTRDEIAATMGRDNAATGSPESGKAAKKGLGGGNPGEMMLRRLKEADKNGDGKISKEEAEALPRIKEHFDAIDENGDGFIDKSELEQVRKMFGNPAEKSGRKPTKKLGGKK